MPCSRKVQTDFRQDQSLPSHRSLGKLCVSAVCVVSVAYSTAETLERVTHLVVPSAYCRRYFGQQVFHAHLSPRLYPLYCT